MFIKRKEVEKMRHRIKELEEKLCPGGEHDWLLASNVTVYTGGGFVKFKTSICRRCGATTRNIESMED